MSAKGVLRRYRQLLWLASTPVFLLVVLLGLWQGVAQHRRLIDSAAADAQANAQSIEALSRDTADHVMDLQHWMREQMATGREVSPDPAIWSAVQPRADQAGRNDGLTLDSLPGFVRRGLSQLLWIDPQLPTPEVVGRLQALSVLMDRAHLRMPDLAWSYYFGWPERHVVLYPWMPSRDLAESIGHASLRDTLDAWYAYALFSDGTPERNAARLPYWSPPYVDADSLALMVSHGAPVYHGDDFRGVVGADLKLEPVEALLSRLPGKPWRAWIVDDLGNVLADRERPVAAGRPLLPLADTELAVKREAGGPAAAASSPKPIQPPPKEVQGVDGGGDGDGQGRLTKIAARLPSELDAPAISQAARHGGHAVAVGAYEVVALRDRVAPWTIVLAAPSSALWWQVLPLVGPYLLIALALLVVVMVGHWMLQRRILAPALGVIAYLQRLAQDEHAQEPDFGPRWQPWLRVVTRTFNTLRDSLRREQRSEALKSTIVDHALAAIVAIDADGRIVEFNPAAEIMFGHHRHAVMGREAAEVIVPERDREMHTANLRQLLGRRVELTACRADGSEFPVEMLLWRVEAGDGLMFVASMFDLSERHAAAREIARQREALRQSEKLTAMGSLLAGVAHELNNPLAIVMGRAALLESKVEGQEAADDARRIREAGERCGRIVRTFLNMARQRPATRSAVPLNDLVQAAVDLLSHTLRSSGITLELVLGENLPSADADADRLGQLILNLIINAQQALAEHEGRRHLLIETGIEPLRPERPQRLWLRVADSGPGVSPDVAERIFTPFFTTKGEGKGTGLGLSVARSVAREHGGDLALEPPGAHGGASFRLSLPVSSPPPPSIASPLEAATEDEDLPALRVLVVDDEPEIADLMREALEHAGYEVATAESGAVALELLDEARFDAVVSDLRMADVDGARLWQVLRERHPALAARLLFVTGDTLSVAASAFLGETGSPSLEKPFAPRELVQAVGALLEAPRSR